MTDTKSIIKYILAVSFIAIHVQGQFLEFSDLFAEDPLSLIWNAKNSLTKKNQTCMVKDAMDMDVEGTCMHSVHCKKAGGSVLGKGDCGHWHSCCVVDKTCEEEAEGRVTYFRGYYDRRSPRGPCTYTVKLINDNICQLRVDILNMELAPPTTKTGEIDKTKFNINCDVDNLSVEGVDKQSLNKIPQICGTNTDQHFYIHLNRNQQLTRAVSLNLHLAQNRQNVDLKPASWAMKVRQLACPTLQDAANKYTYIHHKKPSMENETAEDFTRLAPEGCLQYYTEPQGVVKSFGYNGAKNSLRTTDQDYAVCFKRNPGFCGVQFSAIDLLDMSDQCDDEYIFVPEADVNMDGGKKCMVDPNAEPPVTWISKHPGPLYIHYYVNKEVGNPAEMMFGFKMNYDTNVRC